MTRNLSDLILALSAASRTPFSLHHAFLGLAPQALCCCPLRGLLELQNLLCLACTPGV